MKWCVKGTELVNARILNSLIILGERETIKIKRKTYSMKNRRRALEENSNNIYAKCLLAVYKKEF
jgi:hypothetical protein